MIHNKKHLAQKNLLIIMKLKYMEIFTLTEILRHFFIVKKK